MIRMCATSFFRPLTINKWYSSTRKFSSRVQPGTIYSKIFSEFENSILVPQHNGRRKNIVLKSDDKQVTFLPLSYPGDAPSLLSQVIIPANQETGLEIPCAVIVMQVFAISIERFSKGEKHGVAFQHLDSIKIAQQNIRTFFWDSNMSNQDYYRQVEEIIRAHPEYHLFEKNQNNPCERYKLVWDQASIEHVVKKLGERVIPPYLIGSPRVYALDEPWGKEVWERIIQNIKDYEETKELGVKFSTGERIN